MMPITFVLLLLAIGACWAPAVAVRGRTVQPWIVLGLASVISGLLQGYLQPLALLALGALYITAKAARDVKSPRARTAWTLATFVVGLALALGAFPGFDNPVIFGPEVLSEGAKPYRLTLRFDYAAVGLILLALLAPRSTTFAELQRALRVGVVAAVVCLPVVIALGLAAHYFVFAPKWPVIAVLHVIVTVSFMFVAEEAFFRTTVQEPLHRFAEARGRWTWLPIVVATALFGITHLGRGWALILLASVSGLALAWAYARSRRIEAPIVTHAIIGLTQFFFLTYPALA